MRIIILTPEQAEQVRGLSSEGAALEPVPHGDNFALPVEVLEDPAHASKHEFLASLPQEEVE